jgi:vancomycin resistance protein YoaR
MPERQSTPGGVTAEQDAEVEPDSSAVHSAGSDPFQPLQPTVDDDPTVGLSGPADAAAATRVTESPIVVVGSRAPGPDADATQVMAAEDAPTVQLAAAQTSGPQTSGSQTSAPQTSAAQTPEDPAAPPQEAARPRRRRALLITGVVVAALGLLYGGDLLFSSGSMPRGVTVVGVPVGGIALGNAEQTLRAQIEPRTAQPVPVTIGEAKTTVDPRTAGLSVDWPATVARAGAQPLNPVTRITSLFTSREVGVVTRSDPAALNAALTELKPAFDKPAVEGNIRFDGVTPQPVTPAAGQELDVQAAAAALDRDWASGDPVALPLTTLQPITTDADVTSAMSRVAKPAVSGPVTITGEKNGKATLTPANIAAALTFHADATAGLVPDLNQDALTAALKPQLADSETPGRDATLDFTGPTPVVIPSQDGRGVDYPTTLKGLLPVLTGTGPRQLTAVYGQQPAKLTTEGLAKLGISGIIGEFTTHGFAADSGMNIKRAAEQINGTIVQPGATFSLNAVTNPRDAAHGYVEAGIIEDGHPARGIGGGVSQVATTLYNASYFAGMTNVEHREHSFYISRYPAGREATVFDNVIDLKFRNDNPTAVMIQTVWAPGTITVRIYGTKRYDVTSTPGPRTNPTDPKTVTLPADQPDQPCTASKGAPGFTITDTRTLREISTGQVHTETRTVRYNPSPAIVCGG